MDAHADHARIQREPRAIGMSTYKQIGPDDKLEIRPKLILGGKIYAPNGEVE